MKKIVVYGESFLRRLFRSVDGFVHPIRELERYQMEIEHNIREREDRIMRESEEGGAVKLNPSFMRRLEDLKAMSRFCSDVQSLQNAVDALMTGLGQESGKVDSPFRFRQLRGGFVHSQMKSLFDVGRALKQIYDEFNEQADAARRSLFLRADKGSSGAAEINSEEGADGTV